MMTALAIETMLIGLVLGLRFNVLVLVPATVIGSAFAIAKGMAYSDNIWTILLVMASVMAALQIGYLAGAVFCFVIGDPGGEVFDLPSELLQLRSPSAGGQGDSVKECKTVPGNCSVGIMGVLRACPSKASLRRTRRVPLRRNLAEYQGARGPHGARPKCQQPTSSESS